uniref:Global nitrogen transcriptional regulator n=1 Tax=Gracilaria vermiculophylla TaxID=2608709 RepID=A0A345U979_9FLOR|nr:global nitrogen transcriptional regulator [Gracilaria vermiculophylla]AXI97015.1 global nitrogen transcriptional regulator [Gracilaria vermiculophylla]QXU75218.1 global nitrogen transcriptional regulator [Gracilaria vermiculophylla]WDZ67951.1 global nitrogen transcriptional regulator [Gracilaria vermiculophylla]
MYNEWMQLFLESETSFYVYKLQKGDALVFQRPIHDNPVVIVFYGTVYIMKIFTNGESFFLAILNSNSIIDFNFNSDYTYYKVIALENTYLIKFFWLDFISNFKYLSTVFRLIDLFRYTLKQYENSSYILLHKSVKYRVVQLLLFLCREFGVLNKHYIAIPFELSQKTISYITGSNPITVNKIMKDLVDKLLIKYISKKKILICYFSFFCYLRDHKII